MPRRCLADRLIEMTETEPGLMLAGPAACFTFIRLMRLAARMGSDGVVAFGSALRNLREVSIAVSIPETDLETHVETLIERGVLVREGEALVCQSLREAGRKAAAARANGGLGGRPRRGETAAEARARRQGHLLLPVAGGKPTETKTETLSRAAAAAVVSSAQKQQQAVREETAWIALGRRVVAAAGIDEATWMGGYGEVRAWLAEGLDEAMILEVVDRVASRPGYRPPRSLRYFTEAMREAAAEAAPVAEPPPAPITQHPAWAAWRAACEEFRMNPYGDPPVMPPELAALRGTA